MAIDSQANATVRHHNYYFQDGTVCFITTQGHLFRVHKHFFERESEFFQNRFHLLGEEDGTDAKPYVLDASSQDFTKLLWVWYNPRYTYSGQPPETWLTLFALATRWNFPSIRELAVRQLERLTMRPVDKIVMYKEHRLNPTLLIPSYIDLCRSPLPSPADGERLEMDTVLQLAESRERALLRAMERGCTSPTSADLEDEELREIVMEVFDLLPSRKCLENDSAKDVAPYNDQSDSRVMTTSETSADFMIVDGPVIGIDLGTTTSSVSVMEGTQARVLEDSEGVRATPSVVAFTKHGERLVGVPAQLQAENNLANTIFAFKRMIGRRFRDKEVQQHLKYWPYRVVELPDGRPAVEVEVDGQTRRSSSEELLSIVVMKMRETAEKHLARRVTHAVVTVPASFNDAQRQATKDACRIAGLEVRVISKPAAAALAYGLDRLDSSIVAVYELGGGTSDISILEMRQGVCEVKSTSGDTHLGGDDFDTVLVDHILGEYKKESGIDLSQNPMAVYLIRKAAEHAKIELSSRMETHVDITSITGDSSGPRHINMSITRAQFETLTKGLIARIMQLCQRALSDAGISPADVNEIILTGGTTLMPRICQAVKSTFGREPIRNANADEAAALGASIQGGVLTGSVTSVRLVDVTPLSLGFELHGGIMAMMIKRNTAIPANASGIFTTIQDYQTSIRFDVYQGEREIAKKNKLLGSFSLSGVLRALRGVPNIQVKFNIDADGLVHVSAKDMATGNNQSITVTSSSGLSEEDIKRMITEAENHALSDKVLRALIKAANEGECVCDDTEKSMKQYKGRVDAAQEKTVGRLVKELRKLVEKSRKSDSGVTTVQIRQKISETEQALKSYCRGDHV